MAQPTTAKFGAFTVSLWDGTAFVAPCGFTSKSLVRGRNLSEVTIPDCNDPDVPLSVGREVQSLTTSITGDGVLAAESVPLWLEIDASTDSVDVQIEIAFSMGTLAYVGKFHLESISYGVEQGGKATISVSMQSDGQIVASWTPA